MRIDAHAVASRLIVAAVIVLVAIPYVWGYRAAPPGMVFMGFADHPYDQNSYLSRIQQASEGKFFIRRDFTLEAQRPLFFNPFTWTLGLVCRATGLPPLAVYHAAIAAYAVLLLAVIAFFIRLFIDGARERVFTLALCAFSSGLCWLIPYDAWRALFERRNMVPISYWIAETITFETIFSFPQFALTAALMLLSLGLLVGAVRAGSARRAAAAGLALFALGFVHPVDGVTIAVVTTGWAAVVAARFRPDARRAAAAAAVMWLAGLPSFLYMAYLFTTEPVFVEWSKEAFLSPHPLSYVIGYGLVLFLALPELVRIARRGGRDEWLLLVWVAAVAVLLYAPVSFQRRLSTAVHVPLCVLAARTVFRRLLPAAVRLLPPRTGAAGRRRFETAFLAALLLATAPDTIVKLRLCVREMRANPLEFYLPQGDVEAMRWMLERHNEDAPVLSTHRSGLYLPAYTGNRVYVGHWSETLRFNEKAAAADRVLFGPGGLDERERFLREQGIRYIYLGSFERMRGPFRMEGAPFLDEIYRAGGVRILRVHFRTPYAIDPAE
ncbi:MAG: hypothetical protein PHN82_07345 [bacterium]|nr:hypothetical protein [bacterium]